jgi:hypothetical protein
MSLMSHQGMSGTAYPSFQITGFAETENAAIDLMSKVRICMSGFSGTFGAGASTVTVQAVLPAGGYETYEQDTKRFMRVLDFIFWHAEAVA